MLTDIYTITECYVCIRALKCGESVHARGSRCDLRAVRFVFLLLLLLLLVVLCDDGGDHVLERRLPRSVAGKGRSAVARDLGREELHGVRRSPLKTGATHEDVGGEALDRAVRRPAPGKGQRSAGRQRSGAPKAVHAVLLAVEPVAVGRAVHVLGVRPVLAALWCEDDSWLSCERGVEHCVEAVVEERVDLCGGGLERCEDGDVREEREHGDDEQAVERGERRERGEDVDGVGREGDLLVGLAQLSAAVRESGEMAGGHALR